MNNKPHTDEVDKIDVAIANLVFAGLSLEQMDKIPKWLLENIEKNKPQSKSTALTAMYEKGKGDERERYAPALIESLYKTSSGKLMVTIEVPDMEQAVAIYYEALKNN